MRPIAIASPVIANRSNCWLSTGNDGAWPERALAACRETLFRRQTWPIRLFVDVVTRLRSARRFMRARDRRPLRHKCQPNPHSAR